eukprot:CAMPEP_0205909412 /NCGR_PEP_ID=MMETSP1325-20131115/3855_1 /ASSEMBLY_ACC=CAM_ASM_000708 /TAXON_ID=236786 /ORGANISM="Florenciella sp., Strain RCC1007" /LENGTH=55 /DNA_ID=CAMNT_0053275699 /DNA_START=204 /DNA_END=371 /DNA_ORIENTATION=+
MGRATSDRVLCSRPVDAAIQAPRSPAESPRTANSTSTGLRGSMAAGLLMQVKLVL